MKNRKYCKWHNVVSHSTCECKVSCKEIQSAIEAGRIKYDVPEKPMKIDRYSFPTNMVELKENDADEGVKILTSGRAKRSGAVDPKAQASANQPGGAILSRRKFQRTLPMCYIMNADQQIPASEGEGRTPATRTSRARSKSLAVPILHALLE